MENSFKDILFKWLTSRHAKKIVLGFLLLIIVFFLARYMMAAFLVLATMAVALIMNITNMKTIGIELSTFSVIIFGMVFGAKIGAIMGLTMILLQVIMGGYVNVYILWVIPGYVVAGFVSGMLGDIGIAALGTSITIAMHIAFSLCTLIFSPPAIGKYLPYALSNAIFNFLMFTLVGPWVIEVMA